MKYKDNRFPPGSLDQPMSGNILEECDEHSEIPLEALPDEIAQLINELAEKHKFPPGFSLLYVLYAFSVAIGNQFRVKIKNDWIESAVLYLSGVAAPGNKKTPVQSYFMSRFKDRDKVNFALFAQEKKAFVQAQKGASKKETTSLPEPRRRQILLHDYTQEALIKLLHDNPRGVGVMFDELNGFFGNMERYNNGNEIPMWLSLYNVQPYFTNRKSSEDYHIPHPFVSIIGGIQPKPLLKLLTRNRQMNGMLDRFLFCYLLDVLKEVPTEEEIDPSLADAYNNAIDFLLRFTPEDSGNEQDYRPKILNLTAGARVILFEYLEENAQRVNDLNQAGNPELASMINKFDYHVIRLSLIIQIMIDACDGIESVEVIEDAVRNGIKLANYFMGHSKSVFALFSGDSPEQLPNQKRLFHESLPSGTMFRFSEALSIALKIREDDLNSGAVKKDSISKWVQRVLNDEKLYRPAGRDHYIKKS